MPNRINKKGLSGVIATVIFILLVVLSVGILWTAVNPLTNELSPQFDCVEAQINQPLSIQSACYNTETNDVELDISRSVTSQEINRIDFTITGSETFNYYCGDDCESALLPTLGETKTYYFSINPEVELRNAVVSIGSCALVAEEIADSC